MPPTTPGHRTSTRAHRSAPATPIDNVDVKQDTSNSVQDRIRQWQVQGACALPLDAITVVSAPQSALSDAAPSPEPREDDWEPAKREATADSRGRDSRRIADLEREEWIRQGRASTPRKRVVSDEHWRKKAHSTVKTRTSETNETRKRDVCTQAEPDTTPSKKLDANVSKARAERDERRKRRTEARRRKLENDGGIRIRGLTTPEPEPELEPSIRSMPLETVEDFDSNAPQQSEQIDCEGLEFSGDENVDWDEGHNDGQHPSMYAATLGQAPLYESESSKHKKGVLHKTKEIFGKHTTVPPTSNRLPSIEAWLFEQPDPFVDDSKTTDVFQYVPEVEVPKPLKKHRSRRKTSPETPAPDPNKIWDSIGTATFDEERHNLGEPSRPESSLSSATLKRRGAKATRQKKQGARRSHIKESFYEDQSLSRAPSISLGPEILHYRKPSPNPSAILSNDSPKPSHALPTAKEEERQEPASASGLKRKLTTHEDLMSQLSEIRPSRSTRQRHAGKGVEEKPNVDVIQQVMGLIREDEVKYVRELRTLVDGVIPVLLQCVLSKNDSMATAALFTSSTDAGLDFARPIVDMGVALERLKSLHSRIPFHNVDSLLSWCQSAHKAYSEYLKAWRLGFQDVIVNLAPLEDGKDDSDEVMARDTNGDIVDADGDKVDVAYLLKRPLVRIRKLSKSLCNLRAGIPAHPIAGKMADDFAELTAQARRKHQQEQGRLEDEVAANIDNGRARSVRTLGPLAGVEVDKTRKVRARDNFNMTVYHSTGQRIDCRVEMILRDNKAGDRPGGDVMICQVDDGGKWLLFPPIETGRISARRAESGCDLVVMLRGAADLRSEWHELLALQADEPDAVADWLNMLGSNPLPPKLGRIPSFSHSRAVTAPETKTPEMPGLTASLLQNVEDVDRFDIPLGEPSVVGAPQEMQASASEMSRPVSNPLVKPIEKPPSKLSLGGGLQQKVVPEHWQYQSIVSQSSKTTATGISSDLSGISGGSNRSSARTSVTSPSKSPSAQKAPVKQVQFAPAPLQPSYSPQTSHHLRSQPSPVSEPSTPLTSELYSYQSSESSTPKAQKYEVLVPPKDVPGKRPEIPRSVSPAPSGDAPFVPKLRSTASRTPSSSIPLTDSISETWAALSGKGKKSTNVPENTMVETRAEHNREPAMRPAMMPASTTPSEGPDQTQISTPKRTRDSLNPGNRSKSVPIVQSPTEARPKDKEQRARLSSSPLKHEYAPSSAADSASESESGGDFEYSDDSSSDTSEDLFSELKDEARSLPDVAHTRRRSQIRDSPPEYPAPPTTSGTRTLAPSDSASQGPYRRVPSSAAYASDQTERAIAMVCSWSDKGLWEPVYDDECSIVVSPGLIEAFAMSQMHSDNQLQGQQPLVAFELTPIVPLRKGTALDITIRSPPTAHSRIKTTNNVMFRSRSLAECDALYRMINWARCNNPTYLELQRARPRPQPAVTFSNQEAPRPRSWFSFGSGPRRRNSYRAGSVPPPSMPDSVASSGTMFNALSALKRLSKTSAFSLNRSSVIRKTGRGTSASLYSSDTTTISGSGSSTPAPPTQLGYTPGKDGPNVPETSAEAVNGAGMVNNMKIKLFVRQGQDWKPLGASRLSVLPAPLSNTTPETSRPGSSSGSTPPASVTPSRRHSGLPVKREYRLPSSNHTPHRIHGNGREKRIVITQNKRPDIVLLDEILGESCFEKVAERGVAVKVWTEDQAMRNQGGVLTGRGRVYMMQFAGQSEASWVFGLCGSYRYSIMAME